MSHCLKYCYLRLFLSAIFGFLISINLSAQADITPSLKENLNTVLTSRPIDYHTIDNAFREFSRDSTKMRELRALSKEANYLLGEVYALNALGTIYRNISLYHKAIRFNKMAETLSIKAGSKEFEVISLNLTGVAYRRMDEVKPSLDYHSKALSIATTLVPQSEIMRYNIAVSHNSMGNIYLALEQYNLAISQFEKSLDIEKKLGNRLGLAINFQNIGHAYENLDELDKALTNYRRSLDYNEQIDSEIGKTICYNSIGQVFIKQGKLDEAEVIIDNALKKALASGDKFYSALSYINLGWVQKELGQIKASEKNLKQALNIAKEYSLKSSEVSASELLSELYKTTGKHNLALLYYENSIKLEKTISNERNLKYVNDVIVQFENETKNRQIESLALENEAVREKLETNQRIFWIALLGLVILAIVLFSISSNRRLTQEKMILTLEQDMLRNQMNPHFIFNSLNSIKLYIINNEKENAVYYLNKFSKLIRKILLSSSEKIISLEDELDTMQLYMNIENIRFSNEIDFKIRVEEGINTSAIKVPPLVLQPFLENALWHGLSTIENNKMVRLNVFKTSDNFVTITIEDNGIGRKKSEEFKKDRILKRKSLGLNITKARLTNFSAGYMHEYNLKIEDLLDEQNNVVGTKVILNIPVRTNVLKTA